MSTPPKLQEEYGTLYVFLPSGKAYPGVIVEKDWLVTQRDNPPIQGVERKKNLSYGIDYPHNALSQEPTSHGPLRG